MVVDKVTKPVTPDAQVKGASTSIGGAVFTCAVFAVLVSLVVAGMPLTAYAQNQNNGEQTALSQVLGGAAPRSDEPMLLEADELIYNDADGSVSAVGNVQIAYNNYRLVAKRVTYYRSNGRVIASGGVEIVEPNGNKIYAEEIDITDDFQDGFVTALKVETADNTRFTAESAERRDGELAIFNNGVYTACEPCKKNPDKPPLWQIRARRVIINTVNKTVEYEDAGFELFGKPIAYLPYFKHADPSVKRRTGFLMPRFSHSDKLGYGIKNQFFWALAPSFDLTFSGTYHTAQGFLGEAEWRQRTLDGAYNLRFAGINQQGQEEFAIGDIDRNVEERYAVMSKGKFQPNSVWHYGWNWLWQSDGNFARSYELEGFAERDITNEVYVTGLEGKNYLDVRAQKFLIQDSAEDQLAGALFPGSKDRLEQQQAKVLPVADYNSVSESEIAGGQVSLDANFTHIERKHSDVANHHAGIGLTADNERYHGIAGQSMRGSVLAEWKRSDIINGALITTSLSARADAITSQTQHLASEHNPLTQNDTFLRTMPAASLEIRYPLIASDDMASHIFEPIAQIIARPDESDIGKFANEDAQSLVFGTDNLFSLNKFSGYDRVEGGIRANLGFRYSASFADGGSVDIAAGQSFHIDGENSFAKRDLVNAGAESGLETRRSDYVASLDMNTGTGLKLSSSGRFDETNFSLRRADVGLNYNDEVVSLSAGYGYIAKQPNYGYAQGRHEIGGAASLRLDENWKLFGNASYDLQQSEMVRYGAGIAYDDSCTSFSLAYSEQNDLYNTKAIDRKIMFRLGLRTIGEQRFSRKLQSN